MNRDESGHIHFKIVLWGPFASGKTTMVKWYYDNAGQLNKGGFTSVENDYGQTVYFDYASLSTGGGVFYDFFAVGGSDGCSRERKILLQGSDAIVFVADSQRGKMTSNVTSMEELSSTLGDSFRDLLTVFVLNKRDLGEELITPSEFSELSSVKGHRVFEVVSTTGVGVPEAFQGLMVDLVQRTIALQEIPQAPSELTRMWIALLGTSEGFEPTLEGTFPRVFSMEPKEMKIIASMHPPGESAPSFVSARTDDFYLLSCHTAIRDQFGVSYLVSLAIPADTPEKKIVPLFRRFRDSAPIILGQKDVTSLEAVKETLEQFYIDATDHISSSAKARVESFMPNPRDRFEAKLILGGSADTIGKNVGYLGLTRHKNQFELVFAPEKVSAVYMTVIPIDEYALKTMSKEADRLRANLDTRTAAVSAQDMRRKMALGYLDEMKKLGGSILNTMFNKSIISRVTEDDPKFIALEVDKDLLNVPMEMLYDGQDFLCLKKPMSRWVTEEPGSAIDEDKEEPTPRTRSDNEPLSILFIDSRVEKEPSSTSSDFGGLLEKFFTDEKSFGNVRVKADSLRGLLKKQEIIALLSSGKYDIIHMISSAAVSSGDPTASSWICYDGEVRGHELRKLFKNRYPQLVVSYVHSPPWERKWDGRQQDRIIYTLASSTKLAGPDCFIGVAADALTDSMLALTEVFYVELLKNKKPVGEALREARMRFIREKGIEDQNWVKPILYGNPSRQVT